MPEKPTYGELQKRIAELEAQQQLLTEIAERKRTEEMLRESRLKLDAAFGSMTEAIFVADADGRLIDFNNEFIRYHRFKDRAECSKTIDECPTYLDAYFPNGTPAPVEMWAMPRALRGETRSNVEYMLRRKDTGETWWGSYNFVPIKDENGRITGALVAAREITNRKQAEEALRESNERLRESEERFRVAQELSPDGFAILRPVRDSEGRIFDFTFVYENAAIARINGTDPAAVVGRRLSEFLPAHSQSPFHEAHAHVADTGETCIMERKYDGGDIPRPTWFRVVVVRTGQDIAILSQDITERKQAEEQLIHTQKTFFELVERAPFGIYIVDSQFCIAHMNAGSQNDAFRNVRPLIGRDFSEAMRILWPESVAAEIIGHFRHTLETGEPYYSPRFTNPRHDVGIIESYEWELHQISLPDGHYGVICYYFDSTKLRNAEIALQTANATLEKRVEERTLELTQRASQLQALAGELTLAEQRERSRLAKILHDHLQQLLVAAKFRATVLGRFGDDVVKQASKEVEELIDDSIAASRSLTAELSPPILHEAGLNAGLQWLSRRMTDKHGLFVDLEMEEVGDLHQNIRVFLFESIRELLFNAVKHAQTRSANVNLRHIDGNLQVIVSDQGIGFDPNGIPAAGAEGGGFGLFTIRERLGFMGGTFQIESNPGQGSRFVLSVPIAPANSVELPLESILVLQEPHLMQSKYPGPGRKIRVLLADDHAIFRQGVLNLLANEQDIEVVGEAANGSEAVALAAKTLPDVILMDVSMPKLNGVEATRIIHNDWPKIRIIGLSMFDEEERSGAIRDAGAVDYVSKSGPAEDLIKAIRTHVGDSNKGLSATSQN